MVEFFFSFLFLLQDGRMLGHSTGHLVQDVLRIMKLTQEHF